MQRCNAKVLQLLHVLRQLQVLQQLQTDQPMTCDLLYWRWLTAMASILLPSIHRLNNLDVAACAVLDDSQLLTYLELLDDSAARWAGKKPAGHDAAIYCHHCGPVWVHPSVAAVLPVVDGWPRALGCPWCAIRKVGAYIPRPSVQCLGCRSYTADPVNAAAGMGQCASGKGMHYPMKGHSCETFKPLPNGKG